MNYLKRSFIFGIAVFMAAILGAPALGGQLQASAQPKYSDKDIAQWSVRVGTGYRRGGGYYRPGYRAYRPGYRAYRPRYNPYRPGNPWHYYSPRYYHPGARVYYGW